MITGGQVKAVRKLPGWDQVRRGLKAKVSESTIGKYDENGVHRPSNTLLLAIQRALESGGGVFVGETDEGPGVRLGEGK